MKVLGGVLALLVLGYLGLCGLLFAMQRSLLYFPQPRSAAAPAPMALPVDGEVLQVTVRPRPGARALIYFGGNAEDVALNLPALARAFPDHALYLLHYRGYGGSTGRASEAALHGDALALYERVHAEHAQIVVIGRSLGSGVALRLARERPVARLVLVTPYDSIRELAAAQFPWVPVRWLLRDTYDSARHAPAVSAPTLLVLAGRDEVIPRASSERLLARFAPGIATMRVIDGRGHNDLSDDPAYLPLLAGTPG